MKPTHSSFAEFLPYARAETNNAIMESYLLADLNDDAELFDLLLRGKRLRAGLMGAVFRAITMGFQKEEYLWRLGAAIELAHSASLVFDDMVDEDETRRGMPTLHKSKGHKEAMLDGIGILSIPYVLTSGFPDPCYTRQLAEVQKTMAFGVVREMFRKPDLPASALYDGIISQKTGRLFALAARWGCQYAGVGNCDLFASYGLHVGKAMQIADDIADLTDILNGEKEGKMGSEYLLLKCVCADSVLKELMSDIKDRKLKSVRTAKKFLVNTLLSDEGITLSLLDVLNGEVDAARSIINKMYDSNSVPMSTKGRDLLLSAPKEIADVMLKESKTLC